MGIVSKIHTKSRTGRVVVANAFGALQARELELAVDQVVRGCALVVSNLGLKSTTRRGTTSTWANQRMFPSVVWVKHPDHSTWTVSLGVDAVGGHMTDWTVQVTVTTNEAGQPAVAIDTTSALTLDGALMNGKTHDEIRRNIAHGISTGTLPSLADECAAGHNGFTEPVGKFIEPLQPVSQTFSVRTQLGRAEVVDALRFVQLPIIDAAMPTFALGLPDDPQGILTLHVVDEGVSRRLDAAVSVPATPPGLATAVALAVAKRCQAEVHGTMKMFDPDADLVDAPEGV